MAKVKENSDVEEFRKIVEKYGLNKIGTMVCGDLESIGGILSRDHLSKGDYIGTLIQSSLSRLSQITGSAQIGKRGWPLWGISSLNSEMP